MTGSTNVKPARVLEWWRGSNDMAKTALATIPFWSRLRASVQMARGKQIDEGVAAGLLGAVFPSASGEPPKRGTKELLEAYSTMPWLRAVTSKVAVAVGSTQWRLFGTRRSANGQRFYRHHRLQRAIKWPQRQRLLKQVKAQGELVEVEDHPALNLIHNANAYHVGVAARRVLQVYLDLAGEFFQLLERNALGVPVAYWPIPSTWVKEIPTPSHPFYLLNVPGSAKEQPIPASEMIWASDIDPFNPYGRGSSLAATLGDELETSEYAAKHAKATFFNRARPDFVAWVKPASGESQASVPELRRLQQRWMQEHQGFWRAFKPHFINRELKIHEFDNDLQKQSLVPIMEHERDTIIQVFGFPPEIFGILQSSNRATIDAADYLFAKYAVEPRLEFLREVWQERLLPFYDDRLVLEYDSPVEQDKEHILNVAKAAPYAFQVDELRAMGDHDALEGEEGAVYPVPISVTLESSLQGLGALDGVVEDAMEESVAMVKAARDKANDPRFALIHRIADKLEPSLKRAFLTSMLKFQGKIALGALEAAINVGKIPAIVNSLPWGVLREELGAHMSRMLRSAISSVGGAVATEVNATLGIDIGFTLESPLSVAWQKKYLPSFLKDVERVSRNGIAAKLQQAFSTEGGMSPRQLAQAIKRDVGLTERQMAGVDRFHTRLVNQGVSPAQIETRVARFSAAHRSRRALTIARTETIRAANQGQRLVYEHAVKEGHAKLKSVRQRWLVTPDDRLDIEICEPMEGQVVGLREPFIDGAGAAVDGPPAHPMCRCAVSMEFVRVRA
jgi:hypothetical protein